MEQVKWFFDMLIYTLVVATVSGIAGYYRGKWIVQKLNDERKALINEAGDAFKKLTGKP
jgi:hypothetical protein